MQVPVIVNASLEVRFKFHIEEFKEKHSDSYLDIKVLTKPIERDKGARIRPRPIDSTIVSLTPGPGQYNPKPIQTKTQTIIFTKGKRDFVNAKEKEEYKTLYENITLHVNRNRKGFTFGLGSDDRYLLKTAEGIPGPGYYNTTQDITKPRTTSFFISFDSTYARPLSISSAMNYDTPKSAISQSNYQRFLQAERFPTRNKYLYKRTLFKSKKSNSYIIARNKASVWLSKREVKLKQIARNMKKLKKKIESVQHTKQLLDEEETKRIKFLSKKNNQRRLIVRPQKLIKNWISLLTIKSFITTLSKRYLIKKSLRENKNRLMSVFVISTLIITKLLKILYKFRMNRAIKIIKSFIAVKKVVWKKKRQVQAKETIADFVLQYSRSASFKVFTMKISQSILRLQHWYKRYLVKNRILLSAMNLQWSCIEHVLITKKYVNTTLKDFIKSIERRDTSNVVPINVRLIFIRNYLKVTTNKMIGTK